jgi:iron(III) transport system permease protein
MIDARSAGWPSLDRWPARLHWRWQAPAIGAIAVAAAALAVAPLVSLIVLAFGDTGDLWAHLARYVIPPALMQTALLLAGVAAITTIVGAGTAWTVTTFAFPGRDALTWLLPLPLAIPTYIVAYVYVDILDALGPVQSTLRAIFGWRSAADYRFPNIRSLGGAILLFSFVLYPYVYLAARAMFQTQGRLFTEAARMLGAQPWELARRITFPLARPAIAVGAALALLETLNDIGASEYLGVQTLTLSIFTTWLNRGSLAGAAQMACLLLVIVAALIVLERYGRQRRAFTALGTDGRLASRITLAGPGRWIAAGACFLPVLLGFLLPAGYLLREVIGRGLLAGFDTNLVRYTLTTVALASTATAITLVVGFLAVTALRYTKRPTIAGCVNIAGIGYAVPGTVLALGLLSPLVVVDDAINALIRAFTGQGIGLLLTGSAAALVIAYVIRFLAIATGFAQAGFPNRARRRGAPARRGGRNAGAHDPSAPGTPRDLGGGLTRLRRLPQGATGDAAAASAQRRNAFDLYLPVRDPRQLRARLARGAHHRRRRDPAGHPHHPVYRRDHAARWRPSVAPRGRPPPPATEIAAFTAAR